MCIALFSTAHPDYALILINNRDEYLNRPTAQAHWWQLPNENVLGGRDLLRSEQGTWLGITEQGRLAVLTNFREEGVIKQEARSRGAMVNAFLTQPAGGEQSTESFIESLVANDGLTGVGGFSLVCGKIGEPLAVISNRTPNVEGITWIAQDRGQVVGLSNAAFSNRSWPKVLRGEELLSNVINANVAQNGDQVMLIKDLFDLLSDDTLPKRSEGQGWESFVKELRNSIFIPALGGEGTAEDLATAKTNQHVSIIEDMNIDEKPGDGMSGLYGTQKQTIVLVDHKSKVTFVERTLYDSRGRQAPLNERDVMVGFNIEG
ncbi:hypothetical protein MMC21_005478 [Puttea exsequens]|nr:hypothetical protein [Puttea exsequens]